MTKIEFRRCTPEDKEQAVNLIYSAGPLAYDLVFSDKSEKQSLDFLNAAFVKKGGEFSYDQHIAMIRDGELVGVGGIKTAKQNLTFTVNAAKTIFRFYSIPAALRTVIRGLTIEKVIKPPKPNLAMIHNLAISPKYRGEGLGKQFITHLEAEMTNMAYQTAALDVDGDNPRAQSLYEQLGYQVKTTHRSNITGKFASAEPMVSHYMEKALS